MASPERSPKRQRLSPAGDDDMSFTKPSGADSAYGSTTASQVNGITSKSINASPPIPGLTLSAHSPTSDTPQSKPELNVTFSQSAGLEDPQPSVKQEDREAEELSDHRRTDHERQDNQPPSATENLPLLCRKSYPKSRPHPTQNLLSLYSLTPLANSVARRDPATGAKINKLRKSYEGKIKSQNLPGRNKPTSAEGELMGLMEWAPDSWYDQRVHDRELEVSTDAVKGRLWRKEEGESGSKVERALVMNVGRLPRDEDEKWRAILALDEPVTATKAPVKTPVSASAAGAVANGLLRPGPHGTGMRASAPASPAQRLGVERPERAGKKRRYDDASFEGYEGSWVDDDGYSTGDGRAGRKKRRVGFQLF